MYETVHIISSRKTTEYADYPMPADYPDFPSRQQMLDYLRDYAEKFQLREQIQFNTKVVMAQPLADGRWELELESGEKRTYKGLIVCNGHHWDRRFPKYPGTFEGELMHSKDYRSPTVEREAGAGRRRRKFRVRCCLGGGARRRGGVHQPAPRLLVFAENSDGNSAAEFMTPWLPVWAQRIFLRVVLRMVIGKFSDYGLPEPDHRIFEAHPTINSELLYYVKQGRIHPRPDIARFEGKTVHFVDGTREEFDTVVCATGFHVSFPFLPPGLVPVKGSIAQLYGGCVLPEYKNLYIIGTSQLRYGFGPVVTPGMELMAGMMLAQDKMELPIGLVLKESGVQLPKTHLVDPHAALRNIRRGKRMLPLLIWKEKRLRKKFAGGSVGKFGSLQ